MKDNLRQAINAIKNKNENKIPRQKVITRKFIIHENTHKTYAKEASRSFKFCGADNKTTMN